MKLYEVITRKLNHSDDTQTNRRADEAPPRWPKEARNAAAIVVLFAMLVLGYFAVNGDRDQQAAVLNLCGELLKMVLSGR